MFLVQEFAWTYIQIDGSFLYKNLDCVSLALHLSESSLARFTISEVVDDWHELKWRVCVRVCLRVLVHMSAQESGLNACPWMDIYDDNDVLIKFMAPLELHDQFFVPEAIAAATDLPDVADDDGVSQ